MDIGSKLFAATARELKQRGSTSLMLWMIKENPVRCVCECSSLDERLGGVLIGEKSYDVDDMTVIQVAYSWNDIDDLIRQLSQEKIGA